MLLFPSALRWLLMVISLFCFQMGFGQWDPVSLEERRMDIADLDSWVEPVLAQDGQRLGRLTSRHALMNLAVDTARVSEVDWALAVHAWVRSLRDAHLRVRFDLLTPLRLQAPSPAAGELLTGEVWSGFGPSVALPESARSEWLKRTWPWVGVLGSGQFLTDSIAAALRHAPKKASSLLGMRLEDHGAFVRWVIPSFGANSASVFGREFRRIRRKIRRANVPVMLDLRGNTGGYRSRRHSVLGLFLSNEEWPLETERHWGHEAPFEPVEDGSLVRSKRTVRVPLSVMVDGLSFSASLLLADALVVSGRGKLFGCAPLGFPGGCSGSPVPRKLSGSGLVVEVPTRQARIEGVQGGSYGLDVSGRCLTSSSPWNEAVHWMLSGDLKPRR